MASQRSQRPALADQSVSIRTKLAAAWTSFMFLYIYVDYFHLYKPGAIDSIRDGMVFKFHVNGALFTVFLASVAIPALMVVLSTVLPARANRIAQLVVGSLYIPYSAFNIVGETWIAFHCLSIGLEVLLLVCILRSAWTWPRVTSEESLAAPTSPSAPIKIGR